MDDADDGACRCGGMCGCAKCVGARVAICAGNWAEADEVEDDEDEATEAAEAAAAAFSAAAAASALAFALATISACESNDEN